MNAEPGDYERLLARGDGWVANQCTVRMIFHDGSSVTRRATRGQSEDVQVVGANQQSLSSVADLLRAPDWKPEIRDLGGYLGLTHFLSQSEKPRFLHKEGAEKWELLCDPMGLRPLERVRKRLQVPTTNAFNRARDAAANKLDIARQASVRWRERFARLGELRDLAAASAGLTPEMIVEEIDNIYRELGTSFEPSISGVTPEQALADSALAINAELQRCTEQIQRAATGATVAENWRNGVESLAAAQASLITLQQQVDTGQAALAPLVAAAEAAISRADDRRLVRQSTAARLEKISRAIAAIEGNAEATQVLTEATITLEACEAELQVQTAMRDDAEEVLTRHSFLQHARTHANQELVVWRALALRWTQYTEAQARLRLREGERVEMERRLVDLSSDISKSAEQVQQLQDELMRLEARLAAAQETLGEINRAVAHLAELLNDDDMVCPVCDTRFAETGNLRHQATQCASREHRDLEPLLGEVDATRDKLRVVRDAHVEADRSKTALEQSLVELAREIADDTALGSAVEAEPRLAGLSRDAIDGFLAQSIAEAEAAEAAAIAEQAVIEPYTVAQSRRDLADATSATINLRRRAALSAQRTGSEQQRSWAVQIAAEESTFTTHGLELAGLRAVQMDEQRKLSDAEGELANAERERADRAEQASAAQVAVSAIRTRLNAAVATVARRVASQAQEEQRWRERGFSDLPSEEIAADLHQKAEDKIALCRSLTSRHEIVLSRFKAWRSQEALRRMQAEIQAEIRDVTPEAHLAALDSQERQAEAAYEQVVQAARLAASLSTALRDKQQQFTEAVLDPFSERVTAFERLISPFQHGIHFRGRQHRNRTAFDVGVAPFRPVSGISEEHGVEDFLSEGQISAMGVSVILGASTAYPWSQWPALLLDDPLQHTDLIHATAFIDVLRTLIQERDYQIVISTHDLEEGEFIARKCRRFRIPIQRCLLLGSGSHGVRWRASDGF